MKSSLTSFWCLNLLFPSYSAFKVTILLFNLSLMFLLLIPCLTSIFDFWIVYFSCTSLGPFFYVLGPLSKPILSYPFITQSSSQMRSLPETFWYLEVVNFFWILQIYCWHCWFLYCWQYQLLIINNSFYRRYSYTSLILPLKL